MYKPSEHISDRLAKQLEAFSAMKSAREVETYLWWICAAFATMPAAASWNILQAIWS